MRFKDFVATDADHEKMQIPRQALHAVALKLTYPKNEMKHFIAPLPKDFADWIELKLHLTMQEVETLIEEKLKLIF